MKAAPRSLSRLLALCSPLLQMLLLSLSTPWRLLLKTGLFLGLGKLLQFSTSLLVLKGKSKVLL